MIKKSFLLWSLISLSISSLLAHEIKPAKLDIIALDQSSYQVKWIVPITDGKKPKIVPGFPPNFELISKSEVLLNNAYIRTYKGVYNEPLVGKSVRIINLESGIIDVWLSYKDINGHIKNYLLKPTQPEITIESEEEQAFMANAFSYVILGLQHILEGLDHLMFVLCLLLVSSSNRALIKTVTGFTLGHSITLILSTLDWFTLPSNPVEMLILLSIVFMSFEIIQYQTKRELSWSIKYPWVIAFLFGLIHGFGFSGALKDIGLPQNQLVASLLFFNLGVESGQLLFVFAVLLCFAAIRRLSSKVADVIGNKAYIAYSIGSYSVFLFFKLIAGYMEFGY